MTYIEFFDKDVCENICSCLVISPERVILIGDNKKLLEKHAYRYGEVLRSKGFDIEFLYRSVNKNQIQSIITALTNIIEEYDDCVFDLTGGDELYLTAVGILFERFKDKNLQMHRINIRNGMIMDCDCDGNTIETDSIIPLSIEEYLRLYGGNIVYNEQKSEGTYQWCLDEEFIDDVFVMWSVCKKDVRLWNTQIAVFANAFELSGNVNGTLSISIPVDILKEKLKSGGSYICIKSIVNALKKYGLMTLSEQSGVLHISFKSKQVQRCLTKAGQVLELIVYISALNATEKDGSKSYSDVMTSVQIDWDGNIHTQTNACDTQNEIDVMMMHGLIPIFVSCKNGAVDMNELYKLNTVAERFGGTYSKKVLITTALDDSLQSEYLRARAKDMNIRLVENFQCINEFEINKTLRLFWQA